MSNNRLKRFAKWSPSHQARVLDRLGLSANDFAGYGQGRQGRVLDRALSAGKPKNQTGGAKAPTTPNQPSLTNPLGYGGAMSLADKLAGLQYDQPLAQVGQQIANTAPWFEQYRQRVLAAPTVLAQQNQPLLNQANQAAENAAKPALQNADPNSQASQDDVLAAAGRQALLAAGAQQLANMQGAANTYFQQVGNVAVPAYQQNVQSGLNTQQSQLQNQRGQAKAQAFGDIRDKERTYGLEQAAYGLNEFKAQSTAANDAAKIRQANNKPVTSGPFAGLTPQQINKLSPKQKSALRNKGNGPKPPSALDLAKYDVNKNGRLDPGEAVGLGKKGKGTKAPSAGAQKTASMIRKGVMLVRNGDNGSSDYWNTAFGRLVEKDGLDPIVARAIIQGARTGKLGPHTAESLLREFGVGKITLPGKPGRPKAERTGGSSSGGAVGYPYGEGAGQVH